MSDLSHLRITQAAQQIPYTYVGVGSGEFKLPARTRSSHAKKLKGDLTATINGFNEAAKKAVDEPAGIPMTLRSDAGYDLKLESLDRQRSGIQLLSVRQDGSVMEATLLVQKDKLKNLLSLINRYEKELDPRSGQPKNRALIESITEIRLTAVGSLWTDTSPFPSNGLVWWETWLHTTPGNEEEDWAAFVATVDHLHLAHASNFIKFPERLVTLMHATAEQLGKSIEVIAAIAELRKAKQVATEFFSLPAAQQKEWSDALLKHLVHPSVDAPAVCVLDTGVNRNHLLLEPFLAAKQTQTINAAWKSSDHDSDQHGTGMAGIALYGDLAETLNKTGKIEIRHRLESVKILPPPPHTNKPEVYGDLTAQAVAAAEIEAPNRNRAFCLAVTTDDTDRGFPSSWSGAIDQLCARAPDSSRDAILTFVSAGNIRSILTNGSYSYPTSNFNFFGVEDPGQSWNVVTVGAFTDRVLIKDPTLRAWSPVAPAGDLCPTSRTSLAWSQESSKWPYKPDVVLEGGNYIMDATRIDACGDLSLLTTRINALGALFGYTGDTSAATAQAARMAAILWSHYPNLWPETIRALLIHSARWTKPMTDRFPAPNKKNIYNRLRCYGYGVPDLRRAIYSVENAATLMYEGELQPFYKDGSQVKTKQMDLHQLPWPIELLESLGPTPVTMHVTLSYFVEPSPESVGWGNKHRYQSHGLRFDVIRPEETLAQFKKRLSRAEWDHNMEWPNNVKESRNWMVGDDGRTRGSIHSDWWTGTAAQLAACGRIAIYPVTGWWKERTHLKRFDSRARYSLIVSISTPSTNIDLYTPIKNQIAVVTELET
jgi:hypothetical protein